ncbi:beta-galactosidase trimerization domain-containing protein [Sedimentisphaera salicampi]|uniref:Beta-galactosidase trimerization domain protein n=1 Tax=Sedimentisphaera salicampi TaxID=1941349 RepID=A0A1W6LLK9_9BACT|nr:beta-galactosidase trimerization domain-containing protein [Sedimentisphaera salicampi]ARN56680.1 Beta-galactosidase trimerization domain protein [Sedimentisphaera salicampi]
MINAELKMHKGAMTLFLDGKAQPFTTYKPTEQPDDTLFEQTVLKSVDDLSKRGVDVFFVPIFFDWPEENKYDFSKMDWRIKTVLKVNPQAKIIIRIQAESMNPEWWLKANPEGVSKYGLVRGHEIDPAKHATPPSPSLGSDFWETAGCDAINALAQHVLEQDYAHNIIGYLPTAYNSNEWFFRSYSDLRVSDLCPVMQKAFNEYLQNKYNTDKVFNVPDRLDRESGDLGYFYKPNPLESVSPVVEYYNFVNTLCAQKILKVTNNLRKAHGEQKIVVGTFYGYSQGLANFYWLAESGHLALNLLMGKDGPDFTCSPLEYFSRNFREDYSGGFCWSQSCAVDSGLVAGKGYFAEDDFAPPSEIDINWSQAGDYEEDAALMKRNFAFSLCKGQLMWWYDLNGHWFENPKRLDTIEKCVQIAKDSVDEDRGQISDVAVVMDERASWYVSLDKQYQRSTFWENFYYSFSKIGTTVDLLLLDDIEKTDMTKYKAVFFPTCFCMDNKYRNIVDSLKSNGRSLVFYQASGLLNPDKEDVFKQDNIKELTGIDVICTDMIFQSRIDADDSHPLVEGFEDRCFGAHLEKEINFYVKDDDAQGLAFYSGRGLAGYAVKEFDNWKSYYCAVPGLPFQLVKNIIKDAGVHIYCEDDDVIYANKSYLGIFVLEGKTKKLNLPGKYRVKEVFEDVYYADEPVSQISFDAKKHNTYLLKLERP